MSSNIEVKLDVLNQKGSPALFASSLATRPAASFTGRLFVDSDSPSTGIYRDTGTTWVQVADQGSGTTGTLQQVTTNGNTTTLQINASSLKTTGLIESKASIYSLASGSGGENIGIYYDLTNDRGILYSANNASSKLLQIGITGTSCPVCIDYRLGINTINPSSLFDIHSATGINATFNGTGVTNAFLQFQLAGTGKWNIGNLYNAAANDFIIKDLLNSLNRLTIKNTGQTFIGIDTTSSGALVVNNSTSDNHIVCIGANAPSIRLRNTGTSPSLNIGFGISTSVNNFIQGSANGDYCIFNSSTTASPILFGIYNSGTTKTQEAARISAARNFLIGTTTDEGFTLSVSGTCNISNTLTGAGATFSSNVGIGTTTPNKPLSVISYFDDGAISTGGNLYTSGYFGTGGLVLGIVSTTGNAAIFNNSNKDMLFGNYNGSTNSEKMRIKNTGIVNIVNTPIYATNALALTGGLVVGDIYKNSVGVLSIVF